MKSKILTFIFLLSSLIANAQHVKFYNVEVNNTKEIVKEQLLKKQFRTLDDQTLVGKIFNKIAYVYIIETPKSKIVYQIAALIPMKSYSWEEKKDTFNSICSNLFITYQTNPLISRQFEEYCQDGSGNEKIGLENNDIWFVNEYYIDNGKIFVRIINEGILIFYNDDENYEKFLNEIRK